MYSSVVDGAQSTNQLTNAQQEPYTTILLLKKKCLSFLEREKKSQENEPLAEKCQERMSKRTIQKNKRRDSKGESNDSPEIPDRGKDIRNPRLSFEESGTKANLKHYITAEWQLPAPCGKKQNTYQLSFSVQQKEPYEKPVS